jgi:hypothetical protein
MPGDNNFLQFDPNKVLMFSDADYNAALSRLNGVSAGQASAQLHNKLFYQMSTFIAAFAQAMSNANFNATDVDLPTLTTNITNFLNKGKQKPVGSIYINADDSTNPNILLGYGTWVAISAGKMLLGANGLVIDGAYVQGTYAAGSTGGEATHTLTIDEIPAHAHNVDLQSLNSNSDAGSGRIATGGQGAEGLIPLIETSSVGGGQAHNNLPPYIVVYMWKRTA